MPTNETINQLIGGTMEDKLKQIEELHQHIIDGVLMYKLTNKDVAALLTSVMRNVLTQNHNANQLASMGIAVTKLDPEVVTLIQRMWTEEYIIDNAKNIDGTIDSNNING